MMTKPESLIKQSDTSSRLGKLMKKLSNRSIRISAFCKGTMTWLADHRFAKASERICEQLRENGKVDDGLSSPADFEDGAEEIPIALLNLGGPRIMQVAMKTPLAVNHNQIVFSKRLYPGYQILDRADILAVIGSAPHEIITLIKTYSLGDIIIVLPFLRAIKRMFPEKRVRLATRERFFPLLNHDPELEVVPTRIFGGDLSDAENELKINLDINTLEYDHCRRHPFRRLHRTDILYWLHAVPAERRNYDYSVHLSEAERDRGREILEGLGLTPDEYLIFGWKGSGPTKTLESHAREHLLRNLAARYKILIVDANPFQGAFDHPNVTWIHGLSLMEAMALVGFSRVACVMDSGLLWFAHAMSRPTICFMGPTLEATRLTRHPLYPHKVRAIDLKANVGCTACCFEMPKQGWCKGEVSCMAKPDAAKLTTETLQAVTALWGTPVSAGISTEIVEEKGEHIYVLSDAFPYHRLICSDSGPKYATDYGWETCSLSQAPAVRGRVKVFDPHITDEECDILERQIAEQPGEIFVLIIGDPLIEENKNRRYYRMLFNHTRTRNVFYLSRYEPAELTKQIQEEAGKERLFILPYVLDNEKMLNVPISGRKRKVIFSGNPTERIYPERHYFLRGVRRRPLLWPFLDILPHPGYPDTGSAGSEPAHQIVGDRYISHLSQYRFMFVDPSRCDLELLKFRECAYAGCVPVGRAASSLPERARESVVELDYRKLGVEFIKLLTMSDKEAQERADIYRRALAAERLSDALNERLTAFCKAIH